MTLWGGRFTEPPSEVLWRYTVDRADRRLLIDDVTGSLAHDADWHVGGYWDLGIGYWRRDALPGENENIWEIGFTPVFRIQRNTLTGPYAEAGIGAHLLSRTQIGDKRLSTKFQFGDHLGFGYRFGVKGAWDLGYRFQHLSNASIKSPNDGINFHQVRLQYRF